MSQSQADPQATQQGAAFVMPQPVAHDIGDLTGIARFKGIQISGYDRPWDHPTLKTPRRLADFVWDEDLVMTMIIFFFGQSRKAMKLIGHTGTGKTEGVLQWHSMLNLPLLVIGANPRTEAQQLMGCPTPSTQGIQFVDGPLVTAARYGYSCLIDEYNLIDPGEAGGLNAFLEGKPYTIPETSETIVPAPGFRIFATMNPKSSGYRGRHLQDMANDERFLDLKVTYMRPEVEQPLVRRILEHVYSAMPNRPDAMTLDRFAEGFVKTANAIREQYMGVNDGAAALPCTMSTRTLLTWAELTAISRVLLPPTQSALHWALGKVLADRQVPEVCEALHTIVTTETGEPLETGATSAP